MESDNDEGSVNNELDEGTSDSSSDAESEASSSSDDEELSGEGKFIRDLQRIRNNDPCVKKLKGSGLDAWGPNEDIQNITNEQWEDISNYSYLKKLYFMTAPSTMKKCHPYSED